MATGHPRLAVHYLDGILRLYELASGVFTQITSTGTYPHTPGAGHPDGVTFPPALSFLNDSAYLMLVNSASADDTRARSFDADLTLKSTSSNLCYTDTGSGVGPVHINEPYWAGALHAPVAGSIRLAQNASADPTNFVHGNDNNPGVDAGIRGFRFTPDGSFCVQLHKLAASLKKSPRTGTGPGTIPLYDGYGDIADVPYPITNGAWLTNTLFLGVGALGALVMQRDVATHGVSIVQEVAKPAGSPVAVAASQDGRWIAASFYDGSTYRTAIYLRRGAFLSLIDTVDAFGKLLAFTADSGLLLDAGLKKALSQADRVWSDASSVMANITDNAVAAATSTHIDNPGGIGTLYDDRLNDFQTGAIDLSDLYVTLMTSAAPAFDPSHTTTAAALGTAEITGGNWPTGGVQLQSVAGAPVGTRSWALEADDAAQLIYGTGVSFRYGLIYEKTTDKPVIFIDYQQEYTIPRSTDLTLTFAAGLLSITE